jgi:hypothetical protein
MEQHGTRDMRWLWFGASAALVVAVIAIWNVVPWYRNFQEAQIRAELVRLSITALANQQEWRLGKVQPGTRVFPGLEVRSHARFPLCLPAQPDSLGKLRRTFLAWVDLRTSYSYQMLRPRQVVCLEYELPGEGWLYLVQAPRMPNDPESAINLPCEAMSSGFFLPSIPNGYRFSGGEMEGNYLFFATVANPGTTYERLYQQYHTLLLRKPPTSNTPPTD